MIPYYPDEQTSRSSSSSRSALAIPTPAPMPVPSAPRLPSGPPVYQSSADPAPAVSQPIDIPRARSGHLSANVPSIQSSARRPIYQSLQYSSIQENPAHELDDEPVPMFSGVPQRLGQIPMDPIRSQNPNVPLLARDDDACDPTPHIAESCCQVLSCDWFRNDYLLRPTYLIPKFRLRCCLHTWLPFVTAIGCCLTPCAALVCPDLAPIWVWVVIPFGVGPTCYIYTFFCDHRSASLTTDEYEDE